MSGASASINCERLLKLRLVIARLGEMDNAGWWNTKGLLGSSGSFVLRRGFPITHTFAQARIVFAVATERCQEMFAAPDCVTLWQRPANIEEQCEERWQGWLDLTEDWQPFFGQVAALRGHDVLGALSALGLIAEQDGVASLTRTLDDVIRVEEVPDAAYPSALPAGVPCRGGAPRPGE